MKLLVGAPALSVSRYHEVKCHVSPAWAATGPVGLGSCGLSTAIDTVPAAPEFWIWPGPTNLPIEPLKHRFPALPPGLGMNACSVLTRKKAKALKGICVASNTKSLSGRNADPVAEIRAAAPLALGAARQ